ncbi:MAG: flagellin [Verrucomicrobiota bacterium]
MPEDDPVALRRVPGLQTESSSNNQYARNIARMLELAQDSYSGLKSVKTINDRASEIATQVDDLKSPQELQSLAKEVTEMIKQAVRVMNSTNRGDSIFGSTVTNQPPYAMTLDANGNIVSVTYSGQYRAGRSGNLREHHAHLTDCWGKQHRHRPPQIDHRFALRADLFNHLIQLQNNLLSGNIAGVATDRVNLASDEDNLIYHISSNGAIQSRLETTRSFLGERSTALQSQVSTEVDADLAQTLVKLSQTQTAYEAALQSGAQTLNLSLLDYLR